MFDGFEDLDFDWVAKVTERFLKGCMPALSEVGGFIAFTYPMAGGTRLRMSGAAWSKGAKLKTRALKLIRDRGTFSRPRGLVWTALDIATRQGRAPEGFVVRRDSIEARIDELEHNVKKTVYIMTEAKPHIILYVPIRARLGQRLAKTHKMPGTKVVGMLSLDIWGPRVDAKWKELLRAAGSLMEHFTEGLRGIYYDGLTGHLGVMSGAFRRDKLHTILKRGGESVCFAHLDLNHFKEVNETAGHLEGDSVIKQFGAHLMNRVVRPLRQENTPAWVSREGGDEFAVVAVGRGSGKLETKIRTMMKRGIPVRVKGQPRKLYASVGIARASGARDGVSDSGDQLKRRADDYQRIAKEKYRHAFASGRRECSPVVSDADRELVDAYGQYHSALADRRIVSTVRHRSRARSRRRTSR